jgi:hypothetical protein
MNDKKPVTGTHDAIAVLSQLSGIDKTEIGAMAAQIKANHAKLDSCSYHEFEPTGAVPASIMRQKYQCKNCGGTIDRSAYIWHERGRRANPAAQKSSSVEGNQNG